MKTKFSILFTCMVLLHCAGLYGQGVTNKGKEFWVGYGHHQFMESGTNTQEMILYLSAEQPATVTVSIDSTTWTQTYNVPANTVVPTALISKGGTIDARLFSVPITFGGNGGEGLFRRKGIHIVSNVPIVAYAHIYGSASSGATMLLPIEAWGYSYTTINSNQVYASNCNSWFYVVAQRDSTMVEITPSVPSVLGKPANIPFQVLLMKGQIFQYTAALNPVGSTNGFNASGSKIRSIANAQGNCYPIAVFSGSSRTSNPISCGSGGGDNDNQQCFPHHAWGKKYLTAPTSRSTAANQFMTNSYRVAVKDPTTVVRRNGVVLTGMINNFYFFESNTADYIEADKPIMVAQFMTGGSCMGGGVGDPEMIYLSPIEQGIKRIAFYRNTREAITTNYLTMIVPTAALASVRVDGSATVDHTYAHPNRPGYSVVVKRWTSAQTQAIAQCDSAFTAITYGLGSVESYGYNAGTYLKNLNAEPIIHNTNDTSATQNLFTCTNTPMEISMLCAYKPTNILWRLSQVPVISPNTDVIISSPVPTDSVFQNGLWYYRYNLPGTYSFSDTGSIFLPVLNTHTSIDNCNNTEEILLEITVRKKPDANFSITHTGCVLDTVQFNSPTSPGGGFTVNRWRWTYPDATQDSVQNPRKIFSTPGVQNIQLRVISTEGCVGDTILPITIYAKPTTNFGITPAAVCEGSAVQFSDTSFYGGPASINTWYWDYGNSVTNSAVNNAPFNYTYPGYGSYTVKHVVKLSNLCISDTVTRIVNIYAKPVLGFSYPVGCLPPGNVAQFTSSTTVPDGQAIASYSWNFGDPNATPGNPNTSNLPNPTHTYTTFGTYTIQYSVTSVNGCQKDTSFNVTFGLRPALAYPALAPVCESATGIVSVASASVTNGVPGTGTYRGPGTDAAGNFNPSVAGYGTHIIWYVYTTTAGCADSISQTITVRAKPSASFSAPTGCLPASGLVAFTNNSTVPDAQSLSYSWNFGDGSPASSVMNPTHNYTAEGTYNIRLTVTTNNGCVKDTILIRNYGIQPVLNYPALNAVCENAGLVNAATAVVTNGITGNGVYSGNGVNVTGSFNPAAAGPGTHTIKYVFTTIGGCKDSVTQSITVYPKPVSLFTSPVTICLDQPATFTSSSAVSSGSITNWYWNFGNGNSATNTNGNPFNYNYTSFGNYTVRHVVISNNGCISDTLSRTIAVHALPLANFSLPAAVCMPGSANFTNSTTIGDGSAVNYTWDFGDGSPVANSTNASHTYAVAGVYNVTLTAISQYGCLHDTIKVMSAFFDKPVADFNVNNRICQGSPSNFSDQSAAPNSSVTNWAWSFGDGSNSTAQSPNKTFANPGVYNVQLVVRNAQGCISDPYSEPVTVILQPVIDAGPSVVVPQGSLVTFRPTVNDSIVTVFNWSPPFGLNNPNILRPTYTADADRTFTLYASVQGLCFATDQLDVKILKPVVIPNAFSPNGDGINDVWELSNLADYPGAVVEIYNRYGQLIYKSIGYSAPWDGKLNGSPVPVATYYYIIKLNNGYKPLQGSVTIVR